MPLFGSAEFQQHSESLLYLHKPILCGYLKSDFCLTLLEICLKVKCYFLLWKKQQFFMLFNIWTKMCFCFDFFGVYLLQSSLNLHARPRLSKIEIVSSEIGKNRSKSTSVLIWLCSPGYDIFSSALCVEFTVNWTLMQAILYHQPLLEFWQSMDVNVDIWNES